MTPPYIFLNLRRSRNLHVAMRHYHCTPLEVRAPRWAGFDEILEDLHGWGEYAIGDAGPFIAWIRKAAALVRLHWSLKSRAASAVAPIHLAHQACVLLSEPAPPGFDAQMRRLQLQFIAGVPPTMGVDMAAPLEGVVACEPTGRGRDRMPRPWHHNLASKLLEWYAGPRLIAALGENPGAIIAGGSALWALSSATRAYAAYDAMCESGLPPDIAGLVASFLPPMKLDAYGGDADIFGIAGASLDACALAAQGCGLLRRTPNTLTLLTPPGIDAQFICTSYRSFEEAFAYFDLCACCVGYSPSLGKFLLSPRFVRAALNGYNTLSGCRLSRWDTLARARKYYERHGYGYRVIPPCPHHPGGEAPADLEVESFDSYGYARPKGFRLKKQPRPFPTRLESVVVSAGGVAVKGLATRIVYSEATSCLSMNRIPFIRLVQKTGGRLAQGVDARSRLLRAEAHGHQVRSATIDDLYMCVCVFNNSGRHEETQQARGSYRAVASRLRKAFASVWSEISKVEDLARRRNGNEFFGRCPQCFFRTPTCGPCRVCRPAPLPEPGAQEDGGGCQ